MVNFYKRFLPGAAQIMIPLFEALTGKSKAIQWTEDMKTAFQSAKEALAKATLLIHPHLDVPVSLNTDASDTAVGAVLQQLVNGMWVPLAFFSQQLRPPISVSGISGIFWKEECSLFSLTTNSHLLCQKCQNHGQAANSAISHIFQNSQPISSIYREKTTKLQILCREPQSQMYIWGIDYKAMAEAQKDDSEVQILHTGKSNLVIKEVTFTGDGPTLLCDMSTGRARPIIPTSWK